MKLKIVLVISLHLLALSVFSQRKYTQLYQTAAKAPVKYDEKTGFVFENDTVKITYKFWAERGVFYFDIYNKLSVPLYVDWKKSSIIRNKNKFNYYEDVERKKMSLFYKDYTASSKFWQSLFNPTNPDQIKNCGTDFWDNEKHSESYRTIPKSSPERITFIAPLSNYANYQYAYNVLQGDGIALKLDNEFEVVNTQDYNGAVKTKIYKCKYSSAETALDFRNFLTLSTTDKFDKEFYIDNGFYISSVYEMDKVQFITANLMYCNPTSFYVNLQKNASIDYRKKDVNIDQRIRGVE